LIFRETNGLKNTDIHPSGPVPMFLTDKFEVIEGPTYWAMDIAKKRSKSLETLKQYTTTLAKYLQWRDDEADEDTPGAEAWQLTDEDIIYSFIAHLIDERDEKGRPSDLTIESYIARLEYFFKWAKEDGYKHQWEMDMQSVSQNIKNKSMVNRQIKAEGRSVHLHSGKPTQVDRERDKFIRKEDIPKVFRLFDDPVYSFMGLVFWKTGLRPMELFQLPYRGTGLNVGLRRYTDDELENHKEPIEFEFRSKGKRRSIKFPPDIWAFICEYWMPLRVERAAKYRETHGVMPPNSALFLSEEGRIVTRKMLRDNFNKVTEKDECPEKKLTPYKFRHAFATYFVYDRLKALNRLGKEYAYNAVIDSELREWMGHDKSDTSYKYYVHLVSRYFREDLLTDLDKEGNKELFEAIVKM